MTQNTRSVIQVQASIGGSVGPLSNSATAYSLAATPVFTALSCPGNPGTGITTGSVVTQWNTHPGGPGPENNPTTYQVEYATGNWDRSGPNAGNWKPGIIPRSLSIIDADPTLVTESAVLEGFNPAVPVYIRARSLNSAGQSVDPTVNHNYAYTDEWIDLVSSSDPDGYSSTLQQAPTAFYVIPPTGPTSATLWWTTWPPDSARGGNPSTSFQVLQTTCVVNGTPDFARSSGPMCGIVPPGLDFPALSFSSNTALVTNLNTWVTYYFTLNVADPPHWENNQPNIREIIPIMAAPVLYYTNMPGVTPGSLAVNVSALYGGSISSATVGISAPPQQTQHVISFSAPGGAFPSDTVVTISTFDFHTDPRLVSCPGAQTTLCGGDPNLAFEITANPPLQPIAPLYFTVAYNGGEPQTNDNGVLQPLDPKQAVLLRFDPASCKCVPVRNPGSPDSLKVTGQLNHLSIFQVGTVAATTTPESMRLYPNPYYASRDGYLTIDGVPAESRVRIFTLRGEMVFDGSADSHGIFTWQGTNRGGRAVASGVYLVVVEGNGIKAIRKLALIR